MEMRGSVLALGIVAASNVAAREAEAKVDPLHAQLEAFLASFRRAGLYGANETEMTALWHALVCRTNRAATGERGAGSD